MWAPQIATANGRLVPARHHRRPDGLRANRVILSPENRCGGAQLHPAPSMVTARVTIATIFSRTPRLLVFIPQQRPIPFTTPKALSTVRSLSGLTRQQVAGESMLCAIICSRSMPLDHRTFQTASRRWIREGIAS